MRPYRLYGMASPNVVKVVMALEEMGASYDFQRVDLIQGEQHEAWFRALNPNGKVPVLVEPRDEGNFALFESGAIMDYLAGRHDAFGGRSADERALVRQWLMFQMAGIGPNFGQAIHFRSAKDSEYARNRFGNEMRRLLQVVETRLTHSEYLAGAYSIADMALWPWVRTLEMFFPDDVQGPALRRWFDAIAARPAAIATVARMDPVGQQDRASMQAASKDQRDRYFGRTAHEARI